MNEASIMETVASEAAYKAFANLKEFRFRYEGTRRATGWYAWSYGITTEMNTRLRHTRRIVGM